MKNIIGQNFDFVGKEVCKNHNIKGVITDFDGKEIIDIKFDDEPNLIKQYSVKAFRSLHLTTEDTEIIDFIDKMVCYEAMMILNIKEKYINNYLKNNTVYLFEGRKATAITMKNEPEIYLKIKGIEKRKGAKIFGVLNEPTAYGEKSDRYVFLDSKLFKKNPPTKKGCTVSAAVVEWDIETGRTEISKMRFQLSNGGVWCMPIHF